MSARSYLKGVALGHHTVLRRSPPEPPPAPRECLSVYYPCRELAPATLHEEKPAYDLRLSPRQPAVPHPERSPQAPSPAHFWVASAPPSRPYSWLEAAGTALQNRNRRDWVAKSGPPQSQLTNLRRWHLKGADPPVRAHPDPVLMAIDGLVKYRLVLWSPAPPWEGSICHAQRNGSRHQTCNSTRQGQYRDP